MLHVITRRWHVLTTQCVVVPYRMPALDRILHVTLGACQPCFFSLWFMTLMTAYVQNTQQCLSMTFSAAVEHTEQFLTHGALTPQQWRLPSHSRLIGNSLSALMCRICSHDTSNGVSNNMCSGSFFLRQRKSFVPFHCINAKDSQQVARRTT